MMLMMWIAVAISVVALAGCVVLLLIEATPKKVAQSQQKALDSSFALEKALKEIHGTLGEESPQQNQKM
jgi:hypothetical protein